MKTKTSTLSGAPSVVRVLAGCSGPGTGTGTGTETGNGPANSEDTSTAPFNNAGAGFATMMIPRYEQPTAMADLVLGLEGIDPQVDALAEAIEAAQGQEIEPMSSLWRRRSLKTRRRKSGRFSLPSDRDTMIDRSYVRKHLMVATGVAVAALLAGCSAAETPPQSADTRTTSLEHVHEIEALDVNLVLVATHSGLYEVTVGPDGSATAVGPIGGLDFDPMGFTLVGDTAYASGHPGPAAPDTFGTPNLGLITSTDGGETWTNVSLTGETDFHGLAVQAGGPEVAVFGLDPSAPYLQRSLDGGNTWADGAELRARDILAVDDRLYATTEQGLAVSDDKGMTFAVNPDAPSLYLVAADRSGALAGVDVSGLLWQRDAGSDSWASGGTVVGMPQALELVGERVYVADDRGISFTDDLGVNWVKLNLN